MTETDHAAPRPFEVALQLRWSDQDLNGHVNNARIVTLMEESRVLWTRSLAVNPAAAGGVVVASLTVDYRRQVDYGPELTVRVAVERVGTKSFTVRHVGVQSGEVAFEGSSVMVAMEAGGRSSRALTEEERAVLREHLPPAPGN